MRTRAKERALSAVLLLGMLVAGSCSGGGGNAADECIETTTGGGRTFSSYREAREVVSAIRGRIELPPDPSFLPLHGDTSGYSAGSIANKDGDVGAQIGIGSSGATLPLVTIRLTDAPLCRVSTAERESVQLRNGSTYEFDVWTTADRLNTAAEARFSVHQTHVAVKLLWPTERAPAVDRIGLLLAGWQNALVNSIPPSS